jgi:hypothetical protein
MMLRDIAFRRGGAVSGNIQPVRCPVYNDFTAGNLETDSDLKCFAFAMGGGAAPRWLRGRSWRIRKNLGASRLARQHLSLLPRIVQRCES